MDERLRQRLGGDSHPGPTGRGGDGAVRGFLLPPRRHPPGPQRHRRGGSPGGLDGPDPGGGPRGRTPRRRDEPRRPAADLPAVGGRRGHQPLPTRRLRHRHHLLHRVHRPPDRTWAARQPDRNVTRPRGHRQLGHRGRCTMTPFATVAACAPQTQAQRTWRDDRGSATGWALMMVFVGALLAGAVLDGGNAMAARVQALDIAQQAARAGANQLDLAALRDSGQLRLDPAAATTAARAFLAAAGATGTVTATRDQVSVTVHHHQPTLLLKVVGVATINATATAYAQPATGP